MIRKILLAIVCCPLFVCSQSTPWLHVFSTEKDYHGFRTTDISRIRHIIGIDTDTMVVESSGECIQIPMAQIERCEVGTNVPTIYIDLTDYPEYSEIKDKTTYLDAVIRIDGNGVFDDLESTNVAIKGRGNSTWSFNKKPYRLKFDQKTRLFDFKKAKSYVLIANYIDGTLIQNTLALKTAQLLGLPFTNHTCPVRVFLNGVNKGAYIITEKIGINDASVDIDKKTGILFELDTNYDEDWKFRSEIYNLPVMVKDPDLTEVCTNYSMTPEELLRLWHSDFSAFEAKVHETTLTDADIDWDALVDFMLVYNVFGNQELNHPKSLYIYKTSQGSPYCFGPVWDFDWACGYQPRQSTRNRPDMPLLDKYYAGGKFFIKLLDTDDFRQRYARRWQIFLTEIWPEILDYMDEYADIIRPSAVENGVLWPDDPNHTVGSYAFDANVADLRDWLIGRVEYISTHKNYGLY